jgi:hypothetical protein
MTIRISHAASPFTHFSSQARFGVEAFDLHQSVVQLLSCLTSVLKFVLWIVWINGNPEECGDFAILLISLVGAWGFEPQTPTVSR